VPLRSLAMALALLTPALVAKSAPAGDAGVVVPAKDPADAFMKAMLDALKANDPVGFVAAGTPRLKAMKKSTFAAMSARFAPMLLRGYKTTVLGEKPVRGGATHLWRLELAGGEAFEIEVVTKADKVDAFSIR
jgi:hypothetical protein